MRGGIHLNDKFYNLPKEKQNAIINAGCRVFSENSYKKSPMSEIAKEAGISKALLFYYFKNKKEFYLYLYNYVFTLMLEISRAEIAPAETDFFQIFSQGSKCKYMLLKQNLYLFSFMMKTYYEEDEEVVGELIGKNSSVTNNSINVILGRIDKSKFKETVDIEELIKVVVWCGEGYMKEMHFTPLKDLDEVEAGYQKIIDFFRKSSYKEEYLP